MSERDVSSETRDCAGDAAAYALGALEPAEAEAFRQHLDGCIVCRDELAAFQQVVDVLPMTAPQYAPSRRLRRRVLRAARDEPRSVSAPTQADQRARRPGLSWGWLPRPALALAVLLAVVVVGVGGAVLSSTGSSPTRVVQASVVGAPGTAQLRLSGGQAKLIVNHLAPPPAGHIYEVWLKHADAAPAPTSALFSVTSAGAADVDVPGNLSGVSQVLVTPEPAGGSRVPTHAPVIVAQLRPQ
jgi:anti-sigma-K factor RskA